MLVTFAVLTVAALLGAEARSPYIIGGEVSSKGRWPWQVSLQMKNRDGSTAHACGGSILNDEWILVAAHCVMYNKRPSGYVVKLGMFQLSADDYEQQLNLKEVIQHPDWDPFTQGMPDDLCLLRVDGKINLDNSYVSTVPLGVDSETYAGNPDCWISGWGRDDRNTQNPSDLLKEYNVPVLTNSDCKKKYGWFDLIHPLSDVHVCMGDPSIADVHACHGDSGGPLVCKRNGAYELVGVASRTGSAECSQRPSVYMRVSKYLDWINNTIA